MHVHQNPTNANAVNLYSAAAAASAAATVRAADVRRKLMAGGLDMEGENPFESFMAGERGGSRPQRGQDQYQSHANAARRLRNGDEETAVQALSFWA